MPEQDMERRAESPEISLRDVYYALFRHKSKVVLVFLMVTAVTIGLHQSWPVRYRSEAKLLLRVGRESVTLDPTATTGPIISVSQSRESEINSELEILRSLTLAETVVDSLGADEILSEGPEGLLPWISDLPSLLSSAFKSAEPSVEGGTQRSGDSEQVAQAPDLGGNQANSPRRWAAERIMANLNISVPKASNVISISYESTDPAMAQRVVAQVIDSFLEQHILVHRTPGSYEFFIEETDRVLSSLTQLQEELRRLHNTTGISQPDEQRKILLGRIGDLRTEMEQTQVEITTCQEKLQNLRNKLPELPKTMLAAQTARQMQIDIMEEELRLPELEAKARTLAEQQATAETELRNLNNRALRFSELQREIHIEEERYRRCAENLEQARIDHALETEKISNVSVVQAATFPVVPIGPPRGMLPIGFAFGIFGGLGLALLLNYVDRSFRRPEDVEERLRIPFLASVPRVRSKETIPVTQTERGARSMIIGDGVAMEVDPAWDLGSRLGHCCEALVEHLFLSTNGHSSPPRVLALTSSRRGEGATTVATNLAAALAQRTGERILVGEITAIRRSGTNGDQRYAVRSCDVDGNTLREYDARSVPDLIKSLGDEYRYVLLVCPPVLEVPVAGRIGQMVDGVIMVVEAGRLRWEVVDRAREELARAKANVLGVVLNKRRYPIPGWLYKTL